MNSLNIFLLLLGGVLGAGATAMVGLKKHTPAADEHKLKNEIRDLLDKAHQEAKLVKQENKLSIQELRQALRDENERLKTQLDRLQENAKTKEKHVSERLEKNSQIQAHIKEIEVASAALKKGIHDTEEEVVQALLKHMKMSKEEIFEQRRNEVINQAESRKEKFIKNRLDEVEEDNAKIAKEVLIMALQKYTGESSVDRSHSLVDVNSEKFKAALVGKDAKNIEYLESKIDDMEIIFNDLPKTITIGKGKLLSRQVVKHAIKLMEKRGGEINPKVIDNAMVDAEKVVEKMMVDKAKQAIKMVGLKEVPEGVLKHIGRLHFRTSYGQNALRHCIEVGMFAGLIAAEVGANIEVARVAGFFHDIGKSLSEESDKGHDFITKDILEEFHYPEEIIHAAWAHHEAEPARTLEAKIVMAADALSASRPGARLESLERYLERIRALESTASSFPGVKKSFAISAGREVRILVDPAAITDAQLSELAHNVAEKIENELTYPGNVKIRVIRKQQWDAYAKSRGGSAPRPHTLY